MLISLIRKLYIQTRLRLHLAVVINVLLIPGGYDFNFVSVPDVDIKNK